MLYWAPEIYIQNISLIFGKCWGKYQVWGGLWLIHCCISYWNTSPHIIRNLSAYLTFALSWQCTHIVSYENLSSNFYFCIFEIHALLASESSRSENVLDLVVFWLSLSLQATTEEVITQRTVERTTTRKYRALELKSIPFPAGGGNLNGKFSGFPERMWPNHAINQRATNHPSCSDS